MANAMNQLETRLNDVFGKQAPQMSASSKKMLVEWAPWASLVVGVVSLWSAWVLLHWAQAVDSAANYLNAICNGANFYQYGCTAASDVSRFSVWVWLGLIMLAVEAGLYLAAFFGLRDRKKSGWNFLFYGALVNVAYAVVSLFTDYNGVMNFLIALVGSAVGLWLLFQVRPLYLGQRASGSTTSSSSK